MADDVEKKGTEEQEGTEEKKSVKEKKGGDKKSAKSKKGTEEKSEAKDESGEASVKTPVKKRKDRRQVPAGVVHIQATFNNTVITVADPAGNVVSWSSAGAQGFRGSKKSTPFAAQIASDIACKKAVDCGMRSVEVHIKGPGAGREAALRAVQSAGLKVTMIRDVTPIPHNGCRPAKRRRV